MKGRFKILTFNLAQTNDEGCTRGGLEIAVQTPINSAIKASNNRHLHVCQFSVQSEAGPTYHIQSNNFPFVCIHGPEIHYTKKYIIQYTKKGKERALPVST